jgi:hypothetical protein
MRQARTESATVDITSEARPIPPNPVRCTDFISPEVEVGREAPPFARASPVIPPLNHPLFETTASFGPPPLLHCRVPLSSEARVWVNRLVVIERGTFHFRSSHSDPTLIFRRLSAAHLCGSVPRDSHSSAIRAIPPPERPSGLKKDPLI